MPQSILDLGRLVKSKHPAYADMADDEVGRKVKAKFPGSYDDFMDAPAGGLSPQLPPGLQGSGETNSIEGAGNGPGIPKIVGDGMRQLYHALPAFASSAKRGTSDVIEGVGKTLSPLVIPAAIAAPVATMGAFAGSAVGGAAGSELADLAGGDEETQRLMGNLGSLSGSMAGGAAGESPRLGGYVKGTVKAIPKAAKATLAHHLIPDVFAGAGALADGAREGAKGKLWKGPGLQSLMDRIMLQPLSMTADDADLASYLHYGESRFHPGQYGVGAHPTIPPVEVGGAHVPSDYLFSGVSPEVMATRIERQKYPGLGLPSPKISEVPGGSFSKGMQRGFDRVDPRAPVEVGGGHIPPVTFPQFGPDGWPLPSPEEMQAQFAAPPATSGPTANSATPSARFKPGQYDAPRIRPVEFQNRPSSAAPAAPAPQPASAALPVSSPIQPTIQPIPGAETPAGASAAASDAPYAFTHTKQSMADNMKGIHVTAQQLELPGSPSGVKATVQLKQSSLDTFGKSLSGLDNSELAKMREFVMTHKRLPTKADLSLMGQ